MPYSDGTDTLPETGVSRYTHATLLRLEEQLVFQRDITPKNPNIEEIYSVNQRTHLYMGICGVDL